MAKAKLYIRVEPEDCQQRLHGETPCFRAFTKLGVVCNLCPVELARARKSGKTEYAIPWNLDTDSILES